MKLTIVINTDNAAFDEGNVELEVVGILLRLVKRVEDSGKIPDGERLVDSNGNTVGELSYKEEIKYVIESWGSGDESR